jgi:hypothetical protein
LVEVRHGSHASAFKDDQPFARAIRIRRLRSPHHFRRGKVAFEFQSFSLVLAKDFSKLEHARKYARKRIIKSSSPLYLAHMGCEKVSRIKDCDELMGKNTDMPGPTHTETHT